MEYERVLKLSEGTIMAKTRSNTSVQSTPRDRKGFSKTKDIEKSLREFNSGRLTEAAKAGPKRSPSPSASARLLKELRLEAGLAMRAMAKRLDMNPTTYQHYEDRYKKAFLPFEVIELVRPVLLERGVSLERIDALTPGVENVVDDVSGVLRAPLISWVQAGSFEEAVDPYELGGFEEEIVVEYERESIIALRIKGSSINRVAPEGAIIIIDYSQQELVKEKFFVIRVNGEATVKRYMNNPDRFEPFSTEPDHPIILPTKDLYVVGRVVRVVTAL
jgi:SOS-response transcriptional repressor LexA